MKPLNLPQTDGKCVYHYTSGNGVLNILKKDKIVLQLSCADYLNDTTEGLEIIDHLGEVCEKLYEQGYLTESLREKILQIGPKDVQDFIALIHQETIYSKENHIDSKRYIAKSMPCNVYIMSFSTESDCLPMWNYYGKNGYCIHFNQRMLEDVFKESFECFCEARYVKYVSNIIEELETKIMKMVDLEDEEGTIEYIRNYLAVERYFYKNKAFEHEKEFRLLFAVPITSDSTFPIEYKEKNGYIVPYITVEFSGIEKLLGMVKGITIGPLTNEGLTGRGLKSFLDNREYIIAANNIQRSTIPVRY